MTSGSSGSPRRRTSSRTFVQHAVEERRLDLHHAVVVVAVDRVERDVDLAGAVGDQPVGDLRGQRDAVRRQVVDHHAARLEVVEDGADLLVVERIAAARQAHRAQPAVDHAVDQLTRLLGGDLDLRARVLLVAEVAGDVAAVGEVELGVDRAAAGPAGAGGDAAQQLALALGGDQRPAV